MAPGYLDGLKVRWTDTLGAGNEKYSEYNPAVNAFHEAHAEAVEPGTTRSPSRISLAASSTTCMHLTEPPTTRSNGEATVPVTEATNETEVRNVLRGRPLRGLTRS